MPSPPFTAPSRARACRLVALVALVLLASCVTPVTEIVVRVYSDFGPDLVAVRVQSGRTDSVAPGGGVPGGVAWSLDRTIPITQHADPLGTLGITPRERGDARPVAVRVTATLRGGEQLAREFVVRFEPRKTLVLDVFFTQRCALASAPVCPRGTTCGPQGCEAIDRRALPEFNADVRGDPGPLFDAGAAPADVAPAVDPPPPRLLAPLSTSVVVSRRPALRWALAEGTDGARVELCRARACSAAVHAFDAAGASGAPPAALEPGAWFVRLRGLAAGRVGARTSATWEFFVGARSAPAGTVAGLVLDVNGDGYADVAIGAPEAMSARGAVRVYHGGPRGLASEPAATLPGPVAGAMAEFGAAIAAAGDVNGDGYGDLVVGAPVTFARSGVAYVYHGGPAGLGTTPAASLSPTLARGEFGAAVAGAGDMDGDGYGDVVVGAPAANTNVGALSFFRGDAAGTRSTPDAVVVGSEPLGYLGEAVAGGGDFDGDGLGDVIASADRWNLLTGRVYAFRGQAGRFPATPSSVITGPDGPSARFGIALALAGDVNGDGYADAVVGASHAVSSSGRVYVFPGGAAGLAGTAAAMRSGAAEYGRFGAAVSNAGDLDGDGLADVAVGAPGHESTARGEVFVFRGVEAADVLAATASARVSASDGALFGNGLTIAGSVDGDAHADLAIGAPGHESDAGWAYLFAGSAAGVQAAPAWRVVGADGAGSAFGVTVARGAGRARRPGSRAAHPVTRAHARSLGAGPYAAGGDRTT